MVSGTPVRRPNGQTRPNEAEPPVFGPCKLMDFELEMAFFFGGSSNALGEPIKMEDADKEVVSGLYSTIEYLTERKRALIDEKMRVLEDIKQLDAQLMNKSTELAEFTELVGLLRVETKKLRKQVPTIKTGPHHQGCEL